MHVVGQPCVCHKNAPHRQEEDDSLLLTSPWMVEFDNRMTMHAPPEGCEGRHMLTCAFNFFLITFNILKWLNSAYIYILNN